jgi:hypothetical protein
MSRRITKTLVVGVTALCALTAASSASATNWQSNGPRSFAAATPTALTTVVVRTHGIPSGLGYNCDQGLLSGSVAGPTGPVVPAPWNSVLSFTPSFERCNIAGLPMTISGASGTFDATSYSGGVTTGTFRTTWTANYVGACAFHVAIHATATSNGSTLTVHPGGQSGTISWGANTGCTNLTGTTAPGTATATLTGSTATTPVTYTYSGTAPTITN